MQVGQHQSIDKTNGDYTMCMTNECGRTNT